MRAFRERLCSLLPWLLNNPPLPFPLQLKPIKQAISMKQITIISDYEIIRHGVEHSDYFQGCGTAFSKFEHVSTGIGDTEKEAFEDALESMAMGHSFGEGQIEKLEADETKWDTRDIQEAIGATDEEMEGNDSTPYWHVSIRYNVREIEDNGLRAVEYTAPSAWASYLINGDDSGLEPDERNACNKWLHAIKKDFPVSCEDAGFIWRHDALEFCAGGADCQTYTFLVQENVAPVPA